MEYLTHEAARDFYSLTIVSYSIGLIGRAQTMARLAVLRSLCQPSEGDYECVDDLLQSEKWEEDEALIDDDEHAPAPKSKIVQPRRANRKSGKAQDDIRDPYLQFWPDPKTKLHAWEFHPQDDDFFPSIPHGHYFGKNQPKLDPYEGYIYEKTKQEKRVSRKLIIGLWNDSAFRDISRQAIMYYMTHHPTYNGWRVPNPLKLPRRR